MCSQPRPSRSRKIFFEGERLSVNTREFLWFLVLENVKRKNVGPIPPAFRWTQFFFPRLSIDFDLDFKHAKIKNVFPSAWLGNKETVLIWCHINS